MRALHVLDYSPPFGGGIVDHLLALGTALKGSDGKLILGFPRHRGWFDDLAGAATPLEIPQIRRPLRSRFPRRLRQLCAEHQPDIVHLHFSFALPLSLACSPARWRVPTVYHWHSPPKALLGRAGGLRYTREQAGAPPQWLAGLVASFVDRRVITKHVTVSSEIRELLISNGWTTAEKVRKLANGVAGLQQREMGDRRDGQSCVIGSLANFRAEKDHATLIRAFAILRRDYPACRLILAGDGPKKSQAERLAGELGLTRQVEFLGFVPKPAAAYRQMDIFAHSTHYEGQGLVLLEAMKHGLPVVATDLVGISESISHGVEGLLVRTKDPVAFSKALERLVRDPRLRSQMGSRGRDRVEREFCIEQWVERLLGLYRSILGDPDSASL